MSRSLKTFSREFSAQAETLTQDLRHRELIQTALKKYEQELYSFVESKHPDIFAEILKKRELDSELRAKINKALEEFKAGFRY